MTRIALFFLIGIGFAAEVMSQEQREGRRRRSFDPVEYLKRLDANGNGALEPGELSDRSREFVKGLGFNTDETLSIDKIASKINGDKAEAEKEKKSPNGSPERKIVRKVPGFGVEAPARQGVPDFVSQPQASPQELLGKYGERIMEQVDAAMQRYDKNGDGKIDTTEASEGRWGQPEPKESDLDQDGNLTRSEMAERYYRRQRNSEDNSGNRERESGRGEDRDRESNDSREERNDRESREERSDSDSGSSAESESEGSEPPRSAGGDRYRRYADDLISKYDQDKDGNLSKDEMSEMKQRPVNGDLDGNGLISAGELTEAIANGNMNTEPGRGSGENSKPSGSSGSSRSPTRSENSDSNESPRSEAGSRNSTSRSSSTFSFNASDKNGDGQVQMHEFATDWTDEKLDQFREYDRNRDGVITNAEYRARR